MLVNPVPFRTYCELAEYVITSLRNSGLSVPSTSRIARMGQVFVDRNGRPRRRIGAKDKDIEIAIEAGRDLQQLAFVFDSLPLTTLQDFQTELAKTVKDTPLPQGSRQNSVGRDSQFHLNVAASRNMKRDRQLYNAARKHFGSWRRALQAVGMNLEQARPSSRPRNLNRDKIIEKLQQRHAAGLSLAWNVVCFENRVFAVAAKQLFRSWGRALEAAGLVPERIATGSRRIWDRQRILAAIRLRQQEGKTLQCSRVRQEDAELVSAARRYYSTWAEAVTAAMNAPP